MNKFIFAFERPWVFFLLIPVLAIILIPFFRTPRNKRHRLGRYVALVARILTVILALTLFSGIQITEVETLPPDETTLILVVDHSDSTQPLVEDMNLFIEDVVNEAKQTGETISMAIVTFADGVANATALSADLDAVYAAYLAGSAAQATAATNIEDAINLAQEMMPEKRTVERIVLLSDGRQNEGNAYNAAKRLKTAGIRLDCVSFNVTDTDYAEVALSSVYVTGSVELGETINIRVRLRSTTETYCRVQLFDGDALILESPEAVDIGQQTFSYTYTPTTAGIHALRVQIVEPEASQDQQLADHLIQNNSLCNWFRVVGKASILVVDNTDIGADRLESAVKETYDITTVSARKFPETMEELLDYDEVVLADLYFEDLPDRAVDMLLQYVSKIGRGLFITGGKETELLESYVGTPLEDILPVTMTLDETEYNVALLVVLDISGSMVNENVDRLSVAKEGAIQCLEPLGDYDLFGMVTFGGQGNRYLEMTPISNREFIEEQIRAIEVDKGGGGTNYGDALIKAYHMMNNCRADSKQVIFISDGEPYNSTPFQYLPTAYVAAGMSLSTIYIGAETDDPNSVAMQLLSQIAKNGEGNFYAVKDADGVGDLLVTLTENVKRAMFINEGEIVLYDAGNASSVLNGVSLNDVVLHGYLGSTLKTEPGTQISFYANDHRPVFAEKKYGNGKVGLLLTGLTTDWCSSLTLTDSGNRVLLNMVEYCLNEEVQSSGMTVKATQQKNGVELVVKPTLELTGQTIQLDVTTWDGTPVTSSVLTPLGSAGYYGAFTTDEPNNLYLLNILLTDANGAVQDRYSLAFAGGYIREYDLFSENGTDLLDGIAQRTGGERMERPRQLFGIEPPEAREYRHDLRTPVLIAMAGLILIDIFARLFVLPKKKKKS